MRRAIRDRMTRRESQLSPEGRIRQLIADLTALVDRRDDLALAQSAVLGELPAKRQKPVEPPMSVARAAALGKICVPPLELSEATERQRVLEHRRIMNERRSELWTNPGEDAMQLRQFEQEERARYASASEMMRRGISDGDICAKLHLNTDDILNIREQLGLA